MRKFNGIEITDCFDNEELRFEVDKNSTYIILNNGTPQEKMIEVFNADLLICIDYLKPKLENQKINKHRIDNLITDADSNLINSLNNL